MKKIIIILLFFGVVWGCKEKKKTEEPVKIIDIFSKVEDGKLSDIVDSVKYIPLETNAESLIGSISRIVAIQDRVFVGDRVGNCVLIYDLNGKFLSKINRQGRGPEEYLRLYDFDVSDTEQTVYLYVGSELMVYDYQGNYKKRIKLEKLGFSPISIAVLDKEIFLYSNYNGDGSTDMAYNSVFINKEGKILERLGEYDKELSGRINTSPRLYFRGNQDSLFFFHNFENAIYSHADFSTKIEFVANHAANQIPKLSAYNCEKIQKEKFKDNILPYNLAKIGNRYLYLFMINGTRYLSILDQKAETVKTYDISDKLEYDISLDKHFFDFVSVVGNRLYTYYDWSDAPVLFEKLKTSDDSNPIVTVYYLKTT